MFRPLFGFSEHETSKLCNDQYTSNAIPVYPLELVNQRIEASPALWTCTVQLDCVIKGLICLKARAISVHSSGNRISGRLRSPWQSSLALPTLGVMFVQLYTQYE